MDRQIIDIIIEEILNPTYDDGAFDREALIHNLNKLKDQRLNILFVGATGVGKSSTINAIFNMEIAKVGYSVDPETMFIQKYEMDNLILWDSPGLGDNPDNDKQYANAIRKLLREKDTDGQMLIDEVVVLVDGSSRDMKTAFEIIEKIVIPYIGDTERIVIAINQCDVAMKGKYWNLDACQPEPQLIDFLDQKIGSVRKRIAESTGVYTEPLYYSAYYRYNISKLLLAMLSGIPEEKRIFVADNLNQDQEVWQKNDEQADYNKDIKSVMAGSIAKALEGAAVGAAAGAKVGKFIPIIGSKVGAVVGAALGFLGGLFG